MAVLHLDGQLFWHLTPREIQACFEAWSRDDEKWNVRTGTIAATIRNVKRRSQRDKVWKWDDFFKPLRQKTKIATAQSIDAALGSFAAYAKARAKKKQHAKSKRPVR